MAPAIEAVCINLNATGTPELLQFDQIRKSQELKQALEWRDGLFAPYE